MSTNDPESQADLEARLMAMAAEPNEVEAFLMGLASSLFPSQTWDTNHLTWSEGRPAGASPIDEKADAEAKLRAAEARYRTLVEQIPAVTFMAVLGEGKNEIYVSPHIESMLGFTQKEWLENPFLWYTQLHPDDRVLWNDEFARGCRTGGPFRADCRFMSRDKRTVWVHGEARLVKDDLGRPMFLQGIAFDISDIKEAQERKIRTERLAAVGQLAASVGHDLRNPLAAVRNAHTYIAKKLGESEVVKGDARIQQFFGVIDKELNACTRIIADLLDFARERAPSLVECSLHRLVEASIEIVPRRAGVGLVNEVSENLPLLSLDQDQMRQVFSNLVQNGSEAIPPERPGSVRVTAKNNGDHVIVEIADDGTGIEAAVLPQIFEPLFTTKPKGTGLGLAIVHNIITRHKGSIDVRSTVGKGSVFTLRLPLVQSFRRSGS